ncbi:hypothetical protein ABIF81_002403 [Bradyrhizobium daqingense]
MDSVSAFGLALHRAWNISAVTTKSSWFRYPERAATADVYEADTASMMVDHLLVEIAHLIGYRR